MISAAQHEVNEALLASLQTAADALEGSDAAVGKDYIATAKKVSQVFCCDNCLCLNVCFSNFAY